jgi:hypothetical protein
MNIVCVKWGDKYSAEYVNKLYSMVLKNSCGQSINFYCYTDNPTGIRKEINIVEIKTDLTHWWLKLDLLKLFNTGENILFDLDLVILNPLERLFSVKTRTLSVLYSQWKEGYVLPRATERFPTLYNSSIMKWQDTQGLEIYDYFQKNKEMILFKYQGIDRYLFNEPVQVDLLPTSVAYSYWQGARFGKDTTPEKLRNDYEICILNHGSKQQEIDSWVKDYWIE